MIAAAKREWYNLSMTDALKDILRKAENLSEPERIALALLLLGQEEPAGDEPVPDWHWQVLEERLRYMDAHPEALIPAEEVHDALLKKIRAKRA